MTAIGIKKFFERKFLHFFQANFLVLILVGRIAPQYYCKNGGERDLSSTTVVIIIGMIFSGCRQVADSPKIDVNDPARPAVSDLAPMERLKAWFVQEVLPLESVLIQFLSRGGRSKPDVEDLRQELYMKICISARSQIPHPTRPFVFTAARNLLIDRLRHEQIVPFDTVENLEELNVAIDEPSADRVVIARQELRKLQYSLDKIPERLRTALILRKVDGLSIREIAERTGVAEKTVEKHLTEGMRLLARLLYHETFDRGGVS